MTTTPRARLPVDSLPQGRPVATSFSAVGRLSRRSSSASRETSLRVRSFLHVAMIVAVVSVSRTYSNVQFGQRQCLEGRIISKLPLVASECLFSTEFLGNGWLPVQSPGYPSQDRAEFLRCPYGTQCRRSERIPTSACFNRRFSPRRASGLSLSSHPASFDAIPW